MRTTTDSSLTARALRETEALARELVVAASSSNDPSAALLAACNALEIRMDETAASYVARHVNDADTGTTGANKLAFAALSINRGSAVYKMLVHVAEVTFHRTANVLQPFVEAEDLFDELRMRAWRLPAQQFSEDGILRDPGLMGYLATVARRLAIDHCRRLTARHRRNESWGAEHYPPHTVPADVDGLLDDQIARALERAAKGMSPKRVELFLELLADVKSHTQVLAEINAQRLQEGLTAWTDSALRSALSRFRMRARAAIAEGPSDGSET